MARKPFTKTTEKTELTPNEEGFAADLASGMPKLKAYQNNYTHTPGTQWEKQNRETANKIASRPNVAAEIRRLAWLSCPPMEDLAGMRGHALRVMADLARGAKSEEVRLKSALILYKIAETTRQAAHPRAAVEDQNKILETLRGFYAKIQKGADKKYDMTEMADMPIPLPEDDSVIDLEALKE